MEYIIDANFMKKINNDRLNIVIFTADWCGPCKMIKPLFEDIYNILGSKLNIYYINIDNNPKMKERYIVSSIPYIIFFKDAQMKSSLIGSRSKDSIMKEIIKYV